MGNSIVKVSNLGLNGNTVEEFAPRDMKFTAGNFISWDTKFLDGSPGNCVSLDTKSHSPGDCVSRDKIAGQGSLSLAA